MAHLRLPHPPPQSHRWPLLAGRTAHAETTTAILENDGRGDTAWARHRFLKSKWLVWPQKTTDHLEFLKKKTSLINLHQFGICYLQHQSCYESQSIFRWGLDSKENKSYKLTHYSIYMHLCQKIVKTFLDFSKFFFVFDLYLYIIWLRHSKKVNASTRGFVPSYHLHLLSTCHIFSLQK